MKKGGILHSDLLRLLATVGHGDIIIITDRGFPLPSQSKDIIIIDLGIAEGMPSFLDVFSLIVEEVIVEKIIYAEESESRCPEQIANVKGLFTSDMQYQLVNHSKLKKAAIDGHDPDIGRVVGFIRTGEFTAYSNVMLRCGVAFD